MLLHSIAGIFGFVIWLVIILAIVAFLRWSGLNLHKSRYNKKLAGVCGGIGESLGIDPTIIRIIWAVITIYGGSGILAYILACLILPEGY